LQKSELTHYLILFFCTKKKNDSGGHPKWRRGGCTATPPFFCFSLSSFLFFIFYFLKKNVAFYLFRFSKIIRYTLWNIFFQMWITPQKHSKKNSFYLYVIWEYFFKKKKQITPQNTLTKIPISSNSYSSWCVCEFSDCQHPMHRFGFTMAQMI
jgi:hypothetical protein